MTVKSLEDISIDKIFKLSREVLSKKRNKEFKLYFKDILFAEKSSQKLFKRILEHDCNLLPYFASSLSNISGIELMSKKIKNFKFLKKFNLMSFSCKSLKDVILDEFLENFNMITRNKMRYLTLRKIRIRRDLLLLQFKNIRFLDLSFTNLKTSSLKSICQSLRFLLGLNIASTQVDNLSSLQSNACQLEFLDVHDLSLKAYENVFGILENMVKLRHLDLSITNSGLVCLGDEVTIRAGRFVSILHFLDISGHQSNLNVDIIISILVRSESLKFFVFNSNVSKQSTSDNTRLKQFIKDRSQLRVMGAICRETMLNSLKYSLDNRRHVLSSLNQLQERTCVAPYISHTLNATLIDLLTQLSHRKHDWLISITTVIHNLIEGPLVEQWSADHLSKVIDRLTAILNVNQDSESLTKNILLIVSNEYIVHNIVFDKVTLIALVFKAIDRFQETTDVIQLCVMFISVAALELTMNELESVVAEVDHFRCLLSLICRRCLVRSDLADLANDSYLAELAPVLRRTGQSINDPILQFTLTCLWNLTDECAKACRQFLDEEGLYVYFIMIDRFRALSSEAFLSVCNKSLGVLSNISEDEASRSALLTQEIMDFLMEMLDEEDIQMTYFAAGILCNMLLICDETWTRKCKHPKQFYEVRIYNDMASWMTPYYLLASYRSFSALENLVVNGGASRAMPLWSLWVIRHSMKVDRARHASILEKHQGLINCVSQWALNQDPFYSRIRIIASDILLLLNQSDVDNDPFNPIMIE